MKKLPTKIYLRKGELEDHSTQERMVSCDEPFDECQVEYTNLDNLWHDASEEPQIGSNIVAIDKEGQWWDIQPYDNDYGCQWCDKHPYDDDCDGIERWRCWVCHFNDIQKWAYIDDLLPKGGEK